jgi:hypothetical protein
VSGENKLLYKRLPLKKTAMPSKGQIMVNPDTGELQELGVGERITLPKNQAHNHYNTGDEPAVFIQSVSPALDFDYLLENIIGLTIDGKMPNGKAGLVQELVTLKYLDSKSYLASIPVGVQTFLMNVVAPIARLFGYRAIYTKYSGIEK